jgi:hypothetical protein
MFDIPPNLCRILAADCRLTEPPNTPHPPPPRAPNTHTHGRCGVCDRGSAAASPRRWPSGRQRSTKRSCRRSRSEKAPFLPHSRPLLTSFPAVVAYTAISVTAGTLALLKARRCKRQRPAAQRPNLAASESTPCSCAAFSAAAALHGGAQGLAHSHVPRQSCKLQRCPSPAGSQRNQAAVGEAR